MARGRRGTRGNAEEGWIERLSISGYVISTRISPQYSHHICLCLVYKGWGPTCNQPVGASICHYYCRRTAARTLQDPPGLAIRFHANPCPPGCQADCRQGAAAGSPNGTCGLPHQAPWDAAFQTINTLIFVPAGANHATCSELRLSPERADGASSAPFARWGLEGTLGTWGATAIAMPPN
jgi:hypothetical protein